MSIYFTAEFARSARFADPAVAGAAQVALATSVQSTDVLAALAANPELHPDAIRALIARRLAAPVARTLVERTACDLGLQAMVLHHERRDGVLAVLASTITDPDLAAQLLGKGPQTRTALALNQSLPLDVRIVAARQGANLSARLRLAADCTEEVIGDDELWTWLTASDQWPRRQSPRDDVGHILWLRPQLLDRIDDTTPAPLITAAAGSPALLDSSRRNRVLAAAVRQASPSIEDKPWALLALTANPFVEPQEVLDAVSDDLTRLHVSMQCRYRHNRPAQQRALRHAADEHLRWLTNRAFPGEYSNGRPAEALELLHHPQFHTIREDLATDLRTMLRHHKAWESELLEALNTVQPDQALSAACSSGDETGDSQPLLSEHELEERLGRSLQYAGYREVVALCQYGTTHLGTDRTRWETLWSLLPDLDPSTKVVDLVAMAAHL